MNTPKTQHHYQAVKPLALFFLLTVLGSCCSSPVIVPDPVVIIPFIPTLEWVYPTRGVVMDVNRIGNIVTAGESRVNSENRSIVETYSPQGALLHTKTEMNYESGLVRDILADHEQPGLHSTVVDFPISTRKNYATGFSTPGLSNLTNPYTRYNTVLGNPDAEPYPWSGYISVVGPNIAKGPNQDQSLYYSTSWMVGTFTDIFKPDLGFGTGLTYEGGACPTFGKADCFVVRISRSRPNQSGMPVRHQWGGVENDLAYDVASDDIGNATIFLRAGSDFGITSATQSLVRMKTGYNIVRLDTNGLLTETFPVSLQATGELTDTQIALGKSGTVYILAKDEQRKQYFLAKASRSGTVWTHYFPLGVAATWLPGYGREPRMGLTVDSQENIYVTGIFAGTVDLGGTNLSTESAEAFVASYSSNNLFRGALKMGVGMGVTVRLSPDETALYVNGWASGAIMGTAIPDQSDIRNGVMRPGAFLVKLKIVK